MKKCFKEEQIIGTSPDEWRLELGVPLCDCDELLGSVDNPMAYFSGCTIRLQENYLPEVSLTMQRSRYRF